LAGFLRRGSMSGRFDFGEIEHLQATGGLAELHATEMSGPPADAAGRLCRLCPNTRHRMADDVERAIRSRCVNLADPPRRS